jgi:hypothetical protein
MGTCAGGQKDAAAGSSVGQKDAAAGSSVKHSLVPASKHGCMDTCAGCQKDAALGGQQPRLQIGAGEREWLPAREAKKMQRRAAARAKKMQRRAAAQAKSMQRGGQQPGCRLVPASEHDYLRGRP